MSGIDEGNDDPRVELARLVASFRARLESAARCGAVGVPARKSSRRQAARPAVETAGAVKAPLPAVAARSVVAPAAKAARSPVPAFGDDDFEAAVGGPTGAGGLEAARTELGNCKRCKLHKERTNLVFGVGNPQAHLVFVGEAPGADEDQQGEPFVGRAGQLLTKMIEAMGYQRQDVYICNVVKCRPPGNRNPEPDEIAACEPFLKRQLSAIRPRMIVALGKFAAQTLLRDETPISRLRGQLRTYEGIMLMPTFHPAYLLRDPSKKKETWQDLQTVGTELERLGFAPPNPPAKGGAK